MDVGTRMEYFRKEHQDFLHFLNQWDQAVETTASKDAEQCVRGLHELRDMKPNMKAIKDHCTAEERNVEGPYREYLEEGQLDELKKEHRDLSRLLEDLFTELRFATLYQTERAVAAGREVSALVRRHIQFEEKLLMAIEQKLAEEAEQKLLLRYTQAPE
jgi:hypothetical protein